MDLCLILVLYQNYLRKLSTSVDAGKSLALTLLHLSTAFDMIDQVWTEMFQKFTESNISFISKFVVEKLMAKQSNDRRGSPISSRPGIGLSDSEFDFVPRFS